MAITIIATAGSATANSFITLVEAETYMLGRGNKTLWDAATDAAKDITLAEATQEIDLRCFIGRRTDSTQALDWPRQDATNPDDPILSLFDTDVVPTRIKNATAELAFQFHKAGTTDLAAIDAKANVKRKQVDVLETEYFASSTTPSGLARFPRVMGYIRPLLANAGLSTQVIRG